MQKFLYLILFPLIAASIAVISFSLIGTVSSSTPTETEVLSESEDLEPRVATIDTERISDVQEDEEKETETGEFENMEEFLARPQEITEDNEEDTEPERYTPTGLEIPAVGIQGPVEEVGILDNGQMGVPDSAEGIGWFSPGVNPGEQGNAVVAGHVDSRSGPAVFYDLEKMEAGDEVNVTDENGDTLIFEVTKVAKYDRREAPMEEIFGSTEGRHLNLITCTGTFNQEFGTHDDRLVVYTELVEEEEEKEEVELPPSPENVEVQGNTLRWHAVNNEEVIGYRVYTVAEDGSVIQVDSVATYERKTYTSEDVGEIEHFITSVAKNRAESEPSEIK